MKAASPKLGTPEWKAARASVMKRLAARSRPRQPAQTSPQLEALRTEQTKLTWIVATTNASRTADGLDIGARLFELERAISTEQERLQAHRIPPYAARAATAASHRYREPGEDDDL